MKKVKDYSFMNACIFFGIIIFYCIVSMIYMFSYLDFAYSVVVVYYLVNYMKYKRIVP